MRLLILLLPFTCSIPASELESGFRRELQFQTPPKSAKVCSLIEKVRRLRSLLDKSTSLSPKIIDSIKQILVAAQTDSPSKSHRIQEIINKENLFRDVLAKVSDNVDSLEQSDETPFNNELRLSSVETVVRSNEAEIPVLLDSANNRYVMTKSSNPSSSFTDSSLIQEITALLVLCFACSLACTLFHFPPFFGNIMAGVLLGSRTTSPIQIETISSGFGVMLIMFAIGLEFSVSQVKKSMKFSCGIVVIVFAISNTFAYGLTLYSRSSVCEAIVVSWCLFLSSTAIGIKFIPEQDSDAYKCVVGILVAQDILLGIFISALKVFGGSGDVGWLVVAEIGGALSFLLFANVCKYPARFAIRCCGESRELLRKSHTNLVMCCLSLCIFMTECGKTMGISKELACFVSGMILSRRNIRTRITAGIEPLRDFFSALFFASLGMHVPLSFVYNQIGLLVLLSSVLSTLKFAGKYLLIQVFFLVVWSLGMDTSASMQIGLALAQVSEYTLVLAAQAKSLMIISREVYYLVVCTSSLTLAFSSLLWAAFVGNKAKKGEEFLED